MPVITLSRQFGTGGGAVGRMLAERLGAEYLDRELVALVAARLGIPEAEAEGYDERLPGLWQRLVSALATSSPEISVPPVPQELLPGPALQERLGAITRAVIEEAADRGSAVIIGRGAGWVLAGRPNVLRVQLHASLDDRVRYLVARIEEIPPDARPDEASLRDLCKRIDAARARYLRDNFDVDWNDARHYDLALDTGRLGLVRAADLIEVAARQIAGQA
ncbi:MAG TPA: cytidylate kinase-like family protein [Candidatus Limnocylindrales bacterium]|nr:cytidylate kinase-like family protein [Candidatus Limnocylindrales bacterium]